MPDDFRSRDLPIGTHLTGFQLLTGPDAYLQRFDTTNGARGPRINDAPDGISNTILVVETQALQAVEWTRPDGDLPFNLSNPLASLDLSGLKNVPADGLLVLMEDGSVRNMRPTISAPDFSSYATWRGAFQESLDEISSAVRAERSFFDDARYSIPVLDEVFESRNELKQLMLGMHNFYSDFNRFPVQNWTRLFDVNGYPKLSWRVHLLPYLDQQTLYNQFHLDEAWDSPHNLALLDQMPEIFLSRGLTAGTNLTGYQVVTGTAAYNFHVNASRSIGSITDGTSNTISIVEAPPELAVPWTKPDDIPFNPADPLAAIRALVSDYFLAGMFDGSVRSFHPRIAPVDAAALITYTGAVASGAFTPTPPQNVGAYTVVAVFSPSSGNYEGATSNPVTFSITPAPLQFGISNSTVNDDQPAGTLVGTVRVTDPNVPSMPRTWTYSLVTGTGSTDNARFTLDASGNLRTAGPVDYETKPSYTIRVRATEPGGLVFEQAFTITVQDFPEIVISKNSVEENKPNGTLVGVLSLPNPVAGRTYSYSLVKGIGGTDNNSFGINGSSLTTKAAFNFEAKSSYTIRVRATESGTKRTVEQVLTISVLNVIESPTGIALSSTSVRQGQPDGTIVGTFSAIGGEAGSQHTYSLVPGTGAIDNARFTIDSNGRLKTNGVFVYDKKSKGFSIRVRLTDNLGRILEQTFTITVAK